jgi:hypothetical protein
MSGISREQASSPFALFSSFGDVWFSRTFSKTKANGMSNVLLTSKPMSYNPHPTIPFAVPVVANASRFKYRERIIANQLRIRVDEEE